MENAVFVLLKNYLKKENFKINFEELKLQLLSHPSYPSLHSVTGVLTHFNIPNIALKLPKEQETYEQLPENFIGISRKNKYMLVTKSADKTKLLFEDGTREEISSTAFLDLWNGILVATDPLEIGAVEQKSDQKIPQNFLYFVVPIVLMTYFFYTGPNAFQAIHFILGLLGVVVSALIVKHELGYHSKTLDKFCTSNDVNSCDAVLQSAGASVLGFLKLSDLSIIYFLGMSLTWILTMTFGIGNSALVLATLVAFPITLYSIYYQSRIVKKWCPLCLTIVGLLCLQATSLLLRGNFMVGLDFALNDYIALFINFLVVSSAWLLLKPLLENGLAIEKLKIEHYKFKRNFDLFHSMLTQNEPLNTIINGRHQEEIVLGNKNAVLEVLLVTSPACVYCKKAHTDLEKILDQNEAKIKLTIRFNISKENHEYIGYRVATRLLEVYNTVSEEECRKAIHEVYQNDADLDKWILKWGEPQILNYDTLLETQQNWCRENDINFTPAVLLNGREFPKEYERSDLTFFIEDLLEYCERETLEQDSKLLQPVFQE